MSKYQSYKKADGSIPEKQLTWPLYGPGVEFLGKNGRPVEKPTPEYSDDELLMRVDAVSMCYTDVKEITQGENHPRLIGRNLKEDPIIPGHELSMTVVGVGKKLVDSYKVGDRYTIQPDVWVDGKSIPFCFGMDGGYRQFAKIGKEILEGDAGNYLIPTTKDIVYAAAAITEPWACVEAAYRATYRDELLEGGSMWIIGSDDMRDGYMPETIFNRTAPGSVVFTNVTTDLKKKVISICKSIKINYREKDIDSIFETDDMFDDILAIDCNAQTITRASKKLSKGGILAMFGSGESSTIGTIEIDAGRLHYDYIFFTGTDSLDLNDGYVKTAPRADLLPNGKTWIVGAGGPMGRMHVQRAIEAKDGPSLIIASEVTEERYKALKDFFYPMAKEHNKDLIIVNPKDEPNEYETVMLQELDEGGFDDIRVMVASVPVIEDTIRYSAKKGVISLFAGLKRGVMINVDPRLILGPQQVRLIGHSGSGLDDQQAVVNKMQNGELKPELSVAAVGGMMQIVNGIKAMKECTYPGKIVIYPHILNFPLTGIHEFKEKDPEVFSALGKGGTWTKEAEKKFLDKELT